MLRSCNPCVLTSDVVLFAQAHLHHYTDHEMEQSELDGALKNLLDLKEDYDGWAAAKPKATSRISVLT